MSCFVVSDIAIGEYKQPVNLDNLFTFEPFEHTSTSIDKGRYQILFIRGSSSPGPDKTYWKYKSEADRDCDLKRLIDNYTQTLK